MIALAVSAVVSVYPAFQGMLGLAILPFAQRGPSVQSITGIIIVIGFAPLQDSPVPTVLPLTTTTKTITPF
ncbi:hypothetical protein [Pseudomonas sp. EggHat1]|uniref:hypothetical protein n=1 Tax=Pseudomonas sp. EggHat1 TaxID=2761624 RepID=UPI0018674B98|nr:hypothetical protein [Pseudomonas sp. EggHat1]